MAWIEPKTDWTDADFVTYQDMNRIMGNINYLLPSANLKDDYTQNDFVKAAEWAALLNAMNILAQSMLLSLAVPGSDMTSSTFNDVESMSLMLKERQDLIFAQEVATIYAGDGYMSADPAENYVRGI